MEEKIESQKQTPVSENLCGLLIKSASTQMFNIDKNSAIPLYYQLENILLEKIKSNEFVDKLPSEFELCKFFNISRTTVRQAIDNLIHKGYLYRKHGSGTFIFKKLNVENNTKIGIIIPALEYGGILPDLLRGIMEELKNNGINTALITYKQNIEDIEKSANSLLSQKANGIIYIPMIYSDDILSDYTYNEILQKETQIIKDFLEKRIKVVFIDRKLPGIETDYVGTDNINSTYNLIKYVIESGHKKIGIIINHTKEHSPSSVLERVDGYKKAFKKYNIEIDNSLIKYYGCALQEIHFRIKQFLIEHPEMTAVFTITDSVAKNFIDAAYELGKKIPDDISLVSFDDEFGEYYSLTTIRQPMYEIGRKAVEFLISEITGVNAIDYRINNGLKQFQSILLEGKLIIRNSVKKI